MSYSDDEDEKESFFSQHGGKIIAFVLLAGGAGAYFAFGNKGESGPKRPAKSQIVEISMPPMPRQARRKALPRCRFSTRSYPSR